jgi:hypothetical protein
MEKRLKYVGNAIVAALAWGMLMLISCDYPEQGFFQLVAFDGYGEPALTLPYAVEELVDDTGMTTGFRVLLPIEGELLELPLDDASDMERRAWSLWLTDRDYGLGDLDLTLSHAADRLGFTGAYGPPAVDTPEQMIPAPPVVRAFGGYVVSRLDGAESDLIFGGNPPEIPYAPGAMSWRVERITREVFEELLGCSTESAVRRLSTPRDMLQAIQQQEQDETQDQSEPTTGEQSAPGNQVEDHVGDNDTGKDNEERKRVKSPPMGGRGR